MNLVSPLFTILTVMGFASVLISGCRQEPLAEPYIPEPEWLGSVVAPTLASHEDMETLYYANKLCCIEEPELTQNRRRFYKACHTAIKTHPEDEKLVFECLYLMGPALENAGRKQLRHRILSDFGDHKNAVTDVRRAADRVARVSHQLSRMEFADGNHQLANKIIEDVLDRRRDDIDPVILIAINGVLARQYQTSSPAPTAQQMDKLIAMKNHLEENWSDDPRYSERYASFLAVYRNLVELELTSN